jgi:hypothetical protein
MTGVLDLPLKLISGIVDELDPADHVTLECLALAASVFRQSAQRILLSALTLKGREE